MITDQFQVIHARAAGLDVHKMEITATVLLCSPHGGAAQVLTRAFGTMPKGLSELVDWLGSHRVTAAVLEGTGVYWLAPHDALSDAGIEPRLVYAQIQAGQREKDECFGQSLASGGACQEIDKFDMLRGLHYSIGNRRRPPSI